MSYIPEEKLGELPFNTTDEYVAYICSMPVGGHPKMATLTWDGRVLDFKGRKAGRIPACYIYKAWKHYFAGDNFFALGQSGEKFVLELWSHSKGFWKW